MSTKTNQTPSKQSSGGGFEKYFPLLAIILCFVVAQLIYKYVYGAPANFIDGNIENDPVPASAGSMPHYFGMIYKGGFVVPILHTFFFMVVVFSIERIITIAKASGAGNIDGFVRNIKGFLDRGDINSAIASCDKQKGSVANVVRAGLEKYAQMEKATDMDKDKRISAIQSEIEEATNLEMPALQRNLSILATLASISTLFALFGTVLGMIRAFAALSSSGAPDSTALATGISEALVNTALGIFTSAIAIIAYNYFTGRIDSMTYRIDEAGYAIAQTFAIRNA